MKELPSQILSFRKSPLNDCVLFHCLPHEHVRPESNNFSSLGLTPFLFGIELSPQPRDTPPSHKASALSHGISTPLAHIGSRRHAHLEYKSWGVSRTSCLFLSFLPLQHTSTFLAQLLTHVSYTFIQNHIHQDHTVLSPKSQYLKNNKFFPKMVSLTFVG